MDSCCQVAFHKLASIKVSDKTPDDTMISIFFNKFITVLCDYEYAGRTTNALDERKCLTLLNSLIRPSSYLYHHIKRCERVENKGVVFTSQRVMDDVLEYAKVPNTIQSYAKAQSYVKAIGNTSEPEDNMRAWYCAFMAATAQSTSEELPGLKTNDDGEFTLDVKFYLLRVFIPEEIYLGKLPESF